MGLKKKSISNPSGFFLLLFWWYFLFLFESLKEFIWHINQTWISGFYILLKYITVVLYQVKPCYPLCNSNYRRIQNVRKYSNAFLLVLFHSPTTRSSADHTGFSKLFLFHELFWLPLKTLKIYHTQKIFWPWVASTTFCREQPKYY